MKSSAVMLSDSIRPDGRVSLESIQSREAQSENMQLSSERCPGGEDLVTRAGVSMETAPEVVVPTQVI